MAIILLPYRFVKRIYNNGNTAFKLAKREICSAPGYTIGTRHLRVGGHFSEVIKKLQAGDLGYLLCSKSPNLSFFDIYS